MSWNMRGRRVIALSALPLLLAGASPVLAQASFARGPNYLYLMSAGVQLRPPQEIFISTARFRIENYPYLSMYVVRTSSFATIVSFLRKQGCDYTTGFQPIVGPVFIVGRVAGRPIRNCGLMPPKACKLQRLVSALLRESYSQRSREALRRMADQTNCPGI